MAKENDTYSVSELDLRKKNQWLETLYNVSRHVTSSLSLEKCLKTIIKKAKEILDVERVSLLFLEKSKKELKIKVALGLEPDVIRKTTVRVGEGISGWVALHKTPLLINDLSKDKRFQKKGYKGYYTESLLSVPLIVKEECIGVLNVNNKKQRKIFSDDDLGLLSAFANEAAIAINNARLYSDLKDANRRLKEMDVLKSNFISRVSHELRTPLASMRYLVAAIVEDSKQDLGDTQKEYCRLIDENLERLSRLINNILDLSKIESRKVTLVKKITNVNEIVRKVKHAFIELGKNKGIKVKSHIQEKSALAYVDPDKIAQVLYNLMNNALKFTPKGGTVDIKVRTETKGKEELIRISVLDTGPGIAQDERKNIFETFYQISGNGSSFSGGTGLGLPIAKELVGMHDGHITVKDNPFGQGSVFEFTLPVCDLQGYLKEHLHNEIRNATEKGFAVSIFIFSAELAGGKNMSLKESQKLLNACEKIFWKRTNSMRDIVFNEREKIIGLYYGLNKKDANKLLAVLSKKISSAIDRKKKKDLKDPEIRAFTYVKNITAFRGFLRDVKKYCAS